MPARVHLGRLLALDGVQVVACADPDTDAARALAADVPEGTAAAFRRPPRAAAAVGAPTHWRSFTPHWPHYRPAMDALQAGCHVFVREAAVDQRPGAVDIAGLARGRDRKVGVGHQYRLRPSLGGARRRLARGDDRHGSG